MGYVAAYDDGAVERQTCRYGILCEFGQNFRHGTVEVDFHSVAFALIAHFFRNKFTGVGVEFLNPKAVLVDFSLYVAVGRAAYTQTYGA